MPGSAERVFLEGLEQGLSQGTATEPEVALVLIAGRDVELDADELRGAVRRAVQLLATGGDPLKELDPNGRAVRALAGDLDDRPRRQSLSDGLQRLRGDADGLPLVQERITALEDHEEDAWRWFACTLLAEELADD
jgi:hypothetical protein